jgi:hypothetical protein
LGKLYTKINIVPTFNENNEIVDKYSFLDYQILDIVDLNYKVIMPKINLKNFSNQWYAPDYLKKKLERVIVLQNKNGVWTETNNKWAKEYRQSLKVLDKLVV